MAVQPLSIYWVTRDSMVPPFCKYCARSSQKSVISTQLLGSSAQSGNRCYFAFLPSQIARRPPPPLLLPELGRLPRLGLSANLFTQLLPEALTLALTRSKCSL